MRQDVLDRVTIRMDDLALSSETISETTGLIQDTERVVSVRCIMSSGAVAAPAVGRRRRRSARRRLGSWTDSAISWSIRKTKPDKYKT